MRQLLEKLLLILGGVIFALVLCEVGLRLAGIGYPHFYDFDPVIGAKLRPGIKGYWLKEGGGYVNINRDGLRDREHPLKKPPNTLRIAVLGDSFAEALQVNQAEAFWAVMEKELQGCENFRERNIEVINFGESGFGTTQELLVLQHRVWKYSPDIILLAFYTGNDIADNSPVLNQRPTDFFYLLRDGKLVLDESRPRKTEKILRSNEKHRTWLSSLLSQFYTWRHDTFHILQVIEHMEQLVRGWWSSKFSKDSPDVVKQGVEGEGLFIEIYREPADKAWKEAWKVTEAVLLEMRDEIAQKGAKFYVVVLSNNIQVDPRADVRNQVAAYPGIEDVFYPDRRIGRFCQAHGIPVLLLAPYFQEYAAKHKVYLHGFRTLFRNTLGSGHWNQQGHRLAGQTIAQWLCPQINQLPSSKFSNAGP